MQKTKFFNKVERKWVLIDAKDKVLGRLSTRIARILQGKNKPQYSPNFPCGDKVVVINAKHIKLTGNKLEQKVYDRYSGYPSGRHEINLKSLMERNPARVLYLSVKGMLPRNLLAKRLLRSLRIYSESEYEQKAQRPTPIEI